MRTALNFMLAAIVAMFVMIAPANAQITGDETMAPDAMVVEVPTTNGDRVMEITLHNLVGAMGNLHTEVEKVGGWTAPSLENIHVISVDDLLGERYKEIFNIALNEENPAVVEMREKLYNDPLMKSALGSHNIRVQDVLAIQLIGDDLLVFHQR